ncbi:MAG: single-stranded DNA-binding protein [Burkholderiaceae bacterium]
MKSLNKVQLLGHLGNDPEMRATGAGDAVANLSIATSVRYKDRETGDSKESTEWHRVVAFGKAAELIRDMFRKGSAIYVDGHLRTRNWEDKDAKQQYTTEIVVDEFIALEKRTEPA